MADEFVNIEINGVPVKARKGEMIIRVTDAHGAYVPRFCYHDKLSVAANCRMCLVEVEKAPKPMPACATPVVEGMKVFTKSPRAIGAQRATMEFLLINHPLDCPICDQGGECELQDLAVGFGRDISRFHERKRAVQDENLGPLIATDMTRCIHCTRCIRFTQEIAGYQELGMIGRGEQMKVRTYIEQSVHHEMSGNVIDLCPVGALVSKPYRFSARAWEMMSHPLVSPHDGVGTNLYGHVLRGRLMRVIPRENESINETWIPDRDRFSYEGVYSPERIQKPMLKQGGEWVETDWETALTKVAEGLRPRAADLGVLASGSSTVEELYLLGRLARGLGSGNIDHRLRQRDFRDQDADPAYPNLGMPIAEVEKLEGVLIIGANLRHEMPMLAHRIRTAAVKRGAKVAFLNPRVFEYLFPVAAYGLAERDLVGNLTAVVHAAAAAAKKPVPAGLKGAAVTDDHRSVAAVLAQGTRRAVLLGNLAQRHPAYSELKWLAGVLASLTGARLAIMTEGPNAAGAYLAGAVPHRQPGGTPARSPGLAARAMMDSALKAYVLFGGIDPALDLGAGCGALRTAELVVAATTHLPASLREVAHVVLPIGSFAESSGTYVNIEGRWQSWAGAAKLVGDSRPGWKVLRVLANLLAVPGVDYISSEEIRESLRSVCGEGLTAAPLGGGAAEGAAPGGGAPGGAAINGEAEPSGPWIDIPPYQLDVFVRGSEALGKTKDGRLARDVI